MDSNWSNLPSQNLQTIFKFLEAIDLRPVTLVCKHWNFEVDFYIKDKVWFCADRVIKEENFDILVQSQRHFECIKIVNVPNSRLQDIIKVIFILGNRKLRYPNEINKAEIYYRDYNFLMPILCELGESLRNLHLVASDENWYYGRMKEDSKFKQLLSIEVLKIDGFSNNIRHIANKFSKLKELQLSTNTDSRKSETINIVHTFLKGNPELEKLCLKNLCQTEVPLDIFQNSQKLKELKALTPSFSEAILKGNLNLDALHIGSNNEIKSEDIRKKFEHLRELHLDFCPNIEPLWNLEQLSVLSLRTIDLTSKPALFPKDSLTTLELEKVRDESFIKLCIQNSPNVENCVIRGSFYVFQEIAKYWKKLRNFKYLWKRNEEIEFRTEANFVALEKFSSNIDLSMDCIGEFFEHFKAPNLKTLSFNSEFFYLNKDARGEKWEEVLPLIIKNYTRIENFTLKFNLGFQIEDLRLVCSKLKYLKTLVLEHSVPEDLQAIPDALKLSKSLSFVQILALFNERVEAKLRTIRSPPLRLSKFNIKKYNENKYS